MVPTLWPTTSTLSPRRSSPSRRALLAADGAEEFEPVQVVGWRFGQEGKEERKQREKKLKKHISLNISLIWLVGCFDTAVTLAQEVKALRASKGSLRKPVAKNQSHYHSQVQSLLQQSIACEEPELCQPFLPSRGPALMLRHGSRYRQHRKNM